ncbi:MAG: YihY/virulence factor BrkB family protein [Actinomycetota bacterium]|nr:YihY/virulence factor BrkB family protein [Actinomycetota bacterium]
MSVTERLDAFQQRHPAAGYPLAVFYKFFDDQGNYLAALIAYYAFISLFPLIFLLTTVLGYVLVGNHQLQDTVLNSALGQFPAIGDQLQHPERMGGGPVAVLIGVLGSLYGASGVAQAVQHAMNTAWGVPRNNRPNPFVARGRSLLLIGTIGLAVIGITVLSVLGRYAGAFGIKGTGLGTLVFVATVLLYALTFVVAFRLACARPLSVREVAPGALAAGLFLELLQVFGATFVTRVVARASIINGVFALVLGLLAFLYLAAVAIVFCVEVNVVRVDTLYPRALLTPFTDNVDLTAGDRRAYSTQAEAQRSKGFEQVDVSFHPEEEG